MFLSYNLNMINTANLILKLLKFILPLGLIVLVLLLFVKDLDVDGKRIIVHAAGQKSLLVEGPEPENRVAGIQFESGEKFWVVTIDPVYFKLTLPRRYNEITAEITFQAPGVSLVQFGGLVSERGWNFYWQGLKNDIFEKIDWPCLVDLDRGWYLCQRVKNYQSIDDFLLAPPRGKKILNYNFPLPEAFSTLSVTGFNKQTDYKNFDYFIAKYYPPQLSGQWLRKKVNFPLEILYKQGNMVQFALSAPGIDKENKIVKIKEIKFILKKDPITWKNFLPKIINGFLNFTKR